jgi:hypothetical protein
MCTICGTEQEDVHHARVRCTLARVLRDGMRQVWDLPSEELFRYNGKEWVLNLLSNVSQSSCNKVIFLLWRTWHHRNNIVHGDGKASVSASIPYLRNYLNSFNSATCDSFDSKGKALSRPVHSSSSEGPSLPK